MDFLNAATLKSILTYASTDKINLFVKPLNDAMTKYGIDTDKRVAMFIAQVGHESGSLVYVKELASGAAYDTGSLAISLGNTPAQDGDGEFYKGRGLIQITGHANYQAYGSAVGIDCLNHPELLEQPTWAADSAGWFWSKHNLNKYADVGDLQGCTKIINGGYNGLADRQSIYDRAIAVLAV